MQRQSPPRADCKDVGQVVPARPSRLLPSDRERRRTGGRPILGPLNPQQRQAATAVHGPVAILAGAGTGKTTTITHRIAHQVATGAFPATALLAVTFTEKAARELRAGSPTLGVQRVEARTFHAAALWQLRPAAASVRRAATCPTILDSKAPLIASLANALPPPHKFMPRSELAGEIEWAKNRMVAPGRLPRRTRAHRSHAAHPCRAHGGDLRAATNTASSAPTASTSRTCWRWRCSSTATRRKAAAAVRDRFAAFTVDEYQDVNPLQQALLDALARRSRRTLRGRRRLPDDLLVHGRLARAPAGVPRSLPRRHGGAAGGELPVLAADPGRGERAGGPTLGGFDKTLRATATGRAQPDRPRRGRHRGRDRVRGGRGSAARGDRGVALEEMAVLYRINARSEPFEEAFAAAGIPYQVRDGAFLRRPGPRAVLARLRRPTRPVPTSSPRSRRRPTRSGSTRERRTRRHRGGDAAGRPRPAAGARRRVPPRRRRRGDLAGVRRGAHRPVLHANRPAAASTC